MKKERNKKVFVGVSGGVDSSTTVALLKEQGYIVTGVFIKVWQPDFIECQWKEDRLDAMRVCALLGVDFLDLDLEKEYKRDVFDYMISEYKNGRTPNPDVMCNKKIKFGAFLDFALEQGADYIATGHYVRKQGRQLLKGVDKNKDQSYFLWTLQQQQLARCLFPVGQYKKEKVRKLAKKFDLPTAQKKDSQGLCFVGKVQMKDFLERFISSQKGAVINEQGKVIGEHQGVVYYTIGQRHGFLIKEKGIADKPLYVVAKDLEKNLLVVAPSKFQKNDKEAGKNLILSKVNWILGEAPDFRKNYQARIRYRQSLQTCQLEEVGEQIKVRFEQPQNYALGQSLVVYDGEICLGGGIIQ